MSVDNNEVDKIAQLAKLQFTDKDKESIKNDLNKMLDFVNQLKEVDTENVEPLIYMLDEDPVLREDEVKGHTTQQKALKNAPHKDSDYFKVPTVVKNKE